MPILIASLFNVVSFDTKCVVPISSCSSTNSKVLTKLLIVNLQISFKITIKNLHSKWRNILLMSNNNMFAGGKKATHFWGPRNV